MPNTLGLDDDLDPVEAVISLEKAFDLRISDEEAKSCMTVGDIYDLLHSRFASRMGEPGSCTTSMAFYRLRKSLRCMSPIADCRPDTRLAGYAGRNSRTFLDRLGSHSGLRLPSPHGHLLTNIGLLAFMAGFIGALISLLRASPELLVATIATALVGIVLIKFDPGALPDDCKTVGDLARRASALNYGSLVSSGGAVRPKDLWKAMTEVLAGDCVLPASDMRRDTLILAS